MDKSINFLKSILNKNSIIVVGTSGGPDSMCLLHLLCDLKKSINFKIIVAHMNHKVRKEADVEEKYVEQFARDNNLDYELYTLKEKIKSNFHSESRIIRYKFFEDIIKKYNANYLMTAHHGDDLIETILMRIQRGSTLKGYSGFKLITNKYNYDIIKPLIFYSKEEIKKYMDDNNYKYFIDKTNNEDDYLRNRYRHNVLDVLHKENKDIQLKYLKYSNTILEADEFINNYLNSILKKAYNKNELDLDIFINEDKIIQKRIIEYILSTIYIDDLYLVTDKNRDIIIDSIYNKKPNIIIKLPNNHIIKKEYNKLIVDKKQVINKINNNNVFFEDNNYIIKELKNTSDNSNNTIRLNSKEIKMPLSIHYRNDGDKIYIKNSKGYSKVKNIFIDLKIPIDKRDNIPILYDSNNEILWIPTIKKSKYSKDENEEYDIILNCEEKNK